MTTETLLETLSQHCDTLRGHLGQASQTLQELDRRLVQIVQQLHKNIEVRDTSFAPDFNAYCQQLRRTLDEQDPAWTALRAQTRTYKPTDWDASLALAAKGFNSRAKTLSRACDEFTTAYDVFSHTYKNFTAAKLNVWLLTSCQNDLLNLTGKILFLAREIAKHTERNRGKHAAG